MTQAAAEGMTSASPGMTESEYREWLTHVGKCEFMDLAPFLQAANILVAADEPMRALSLLNNLPGYYRDHPPAQVQELMGEIYRLLATPAFYSTNPYDQFVRPETGAWTLQNTQRGVLIEQDVKAFNAEGKMPHLIDLGPGEYWLPIGLKQLGHTFTYHDIGLCGPARAKAKEFVGEFMRSETPTDRPVIFVACEIIEHLHHEEDIAVEFHRARANADIIHISTPKYTFDCRASQLDWQKKGDLGHLRTYTPGEFFQVVSKMFPNYQFNFLDGQILHLRGLKAN